MDSFLRHTADSIRQQLGWEALRTTTLVLPTRRAGLVLKNELMQLQQQSGRKAVFAPQVLTLTELFDRLSPLYKEDELYTIARLYRLYLKSPIVNLQSSIAAENDPMPLDLFYGWGQQMIADFTNIDASMPAEQVPNFFENTIAAHELSQWQLDEEVENRLRALINPCAGQLTPQDKSLRIRFERLWRSMADLYQGLRTEMQSERKGYDGMRQRSVIEQWETILPTLAGQHFAFVGFNYLLPVEKQLMTLLRNSGQATFYWDYVRDFQTNTKAFAFANLNQNDLANGLPVRDWGQPREVTVISASSHAAQAQYVNEWLRTHYTHAGQRVGVVICDEAMLEPVIYALPALSVLDDNNQSTPALVNITKGFPLRNTRIFAQVVREADQWTDTLNWDTLLCLVDTPPLDEQTENLTWQDLLIAESVFQARACILKLRQLVTDGISGVEFTPRLTAMLLRRMMESVTMPFHGEPVTDVQVLGVLETRMLDFDSVLLLNVEEGVLPQQQQDSSFIPYYLRKSYHMQTADERATVYAYNFFRLLSRVGDATLLFTPAEANGDSKGLSRFLLQMMASPEFVITRRQLAEPARIDSSDLVDETGQTYTRPSISPSAINTYIDCPRRFYLQYIEQLRSEDKEDTFYAPNILGSFVHHAMEYIYREKCGCTNTRPVSVSPAQIDAILSSPEQLQEALDAAYVAMNQEWLENHPDGEAEHYVPALHLVENQVLIRYISNVLERDKHDAAQGLQIYLLEQPRYMNLSIDGVGTVRTGGIIDRLDIIGQGANRRMRIVDYKSGNYDEKKMSTAADALFSDADKKYIRQTLLYSAAVMATEPNLHLPLQPNLFFCSKPMLEQETRVAVADQPIDDFQTIQSDFLAGLQAKIQEIYTATSFPQQRATEECAPHCPFLTLCGRKTRKN